MENNASKGISPNSQDPSRNRVRIFSEFDLSYGGGERLMKMIAEYFCKNNIPTYIYVNSKSGVKSEGLNGCADDAIISEKFHRYGFPKFLYQYFPDLELIENDKNTLNLIFIRRVPPKKILKILSKSESKIVFCLHGIALERLRFTNPAIISHQILMRFKIRHLAKFTKGNIYVQSLLPDLSQRLIRLGAIESNIFTIENEFEIPVFEVKRNDTEFNVVFIGRIEDLSKGIRRLRSTIFKIFKKNTKIKFNLIGTGNDKNILNNIPNNAKYWGKVNDEKKIEIIQSSNLALVTSNLEPYSLVILEYLFSGIPVISTPASGPSYVLSKNPIYGKVSSFRPSVLADDIIEYYNKWINNKDAYFNLKINIAKSSKDLYNSNHMLEAYKLMALKILEINENEV